MGTFAHVVADDAVLERIADAPAGLLARINAIMLEHGSRRAGLSPIAAERVYDEEAHAIRALHPRAHTLEDLAFGQGLRRFRAFDVVSEHGLDEHSGSTSDRELMLAILDRQRAYRFEHLIGATPEEQDACNAEHVARCDRAIAEVRAGNVREVAWY